jgi:signal transduction histidine kinase
MSDLRVELARVREALRVATGDRWHIDPDREDLLDGAGIGTLFLDTELRIRRLNPAVTRVLQLAAHDVGRSIEEFAHDLGAEFLDDVRSALREARTVERDVRSANGTWLRVTHRPTSDPAKARTGVVVTLADVTPLRNAHEMTRMANEQLEAANQELARRQDELEELFSIVAHDLKRPLIAMDGLLSLVPDRIAASNTDEAAALTARARHECDRMKRMLDDLARVSALSREDVVMEDVDLRVWLEGIVGQVREIAAQRGVRFTCSSDAGHVRLPANALEQSAVNLLENALNYGCTGEKPRIDVSCRLQPGRVELSVRDNGKGIAPSDHQKVFEPYRRLDPDLAAGSGVGLMAVRRLVTRASGTVTLQSDRGRGANFTVRVPATFDAEQAAAVAPRPRVLVVEDDALDAKVIARYLGEDFVVTRAEDLARASACLERDTFDLVLLDLSLPDGHGFLLVNDVRAKLPKGTPIVVITGHGGGIALDSISATIAGVVAKEALTKETLRSAIADALEPARAHG